MSEAIVEKQYIKGQKLNFEIESFYQTEEKFLESLYRLDKEQAQQVIKGLVKQVLAYSAEDQLKYLKYYFVTLFGIVARHIAKRQGSLEKGFAYNSTTILLIDEKLTVENANDLADELIVFYIYMIAKKRAPKLAHPTVNKVIQYIDKEIESAMTVEGLAKSFDVSTSHLSRIFREHTGITLVEYINIKKVEESQYYLRFSEERIAEVSVHFNFCNQSYYTRTFKKYTGETPKRFRNNLTSNYFKFTLPVEEKQLASSE